MLHIATSVFSNPPPTYTNTLTVNGINPLGTTTDRFFLVRTVGNDAQVQNGDQFDIYTAVDNGSGTLVLGTKINGSSTFATPNAYSNTAAGDSYIVLGMYNGPNYIMSLTGFSSENTEAEEDGGSGTFVVEQGGDLADGGDGELDLTEIQASDPDAGVICFVAGTPILTPTGSINVESLAPGDLVITRDNGPVCVRWVGRQHIRAGITSQHLMPVRLAAGCLGPNRPSQRIEVSPAHRLLFDDPCCQTILGCDAVLIPARQLVGQSGISTRPIGRDGIVYVHIMFDQHEIIWSAGLPSESFRPAAHSQRILDHNILSELDELFPNAPHGDALLQPFPAYRPTTRSHEAIALMRGRQGNGGSAHRAA
ncbi:Hint domain-containing protein [Monaibacterium marinum]|uniref:Hint domain-containing protein n=1 Tax=Pontivivens marinum TaxID=1690039 RepID=UPI0011AFABB6|nr:Hint domain-containing protein [Monaibacterium marinum]